MRKFPALATLILFLCAACGSAVAVADPPPPSARPVLLTVSIPTVTAAPPAATATVTIPARPTNAAAPEITLLFVGDINPGRCVYAKSANDLALPYRPLAEYLQAADLTIGSLDAAISDYNPPAPCAETRNLLAPAKTVQGLQFAGFDVLSVATNHAQDCGLQRGCVNEALFDTLANLRAAGIQPAGAGRNLAEAAAPVILKVHGVRFAFLGFSAIPPLRWATAAEAGVAPLKPEVYRDAVRKAAAQADVVIVMPHWGTEYSPYVNWEQYKAAQDLVDAGANLIVGNHPHHVQGVEYFANGAVVAYALGNFVFDQEWSDGRQFPIQGLMLKVFFRGAQLTGTQMIPIHIYDNFQPRLAPPAEAELILQDVAASMSRLPPRKK